jgi:nucleoid DNA-binding protein
MTLTKQQIARRISEAEALSQREATRRVDEVLRAMMARFAAGEKVMVTNFGTFEVVERAPRRGINPASGERSVIPAHRSVAFRAAPRLLRHVDE